MVTPLEHGAITASASRSAPSSSQPCARRRHRVRERRARATKSQPCRRPTNGSKHAPSRTPSCAACSALRASLPARTVAADVVGYAPEASRREIAIDRGRRDGVKRDASSSTARASSATSIDAGAHDAHVLLIIDPTSAVPAYLLRSTRSWGIVVRHVAARARMKYIGQDVKVLAGDMVVTGLGEIYPGGIPIGAVREVDRKDNALYQSAVLEPAVDFASLTHVLVLDSRSEHVSTRLATPDRLRGGPRAARRGPRPSTRRSRSRRAFRSCSRSALVASLILQSTLLSGRRRCAARTSACVTVLVVWTGLRCGVVDRRMARAHRGVVRRRARRRRRERDRLRRSSGFGAGMLANRFFCGFAAGVRRRGRARDASATLGRLDLCSRSRSVNAVCSSALSHELVWQTLLNCAVAVVALAVMRVISRLRRTATFAGRRRTLVRPEEAPQRARAASRSFGGSLPSSSSSSGGSPTCSCATAPYYEQAGQSQPAADHSGDRAARSASTTATASSSRATVRRSSCRSCRCSSQRSGKPRCASLRCILGVSRRARCGSGCSTKTASAYKNFDDLAAAMPLGPINVAEDLKPPVVGRFSERADQLPGMSVELVPVRDYPYGTLGVAHSSATSGRSPQANTRRARQRLRPERHRRRGRPRGRRTIRCCAARGGRQIKVNSAGQAVANVGDFAPFPATISTSPSTGGCSAPPRRPSPTQIKLVHEDASAIASAGRRSSRIRTPARCSRSSASRTSIPTISPPASATKRYACLPARPAALRSSTVRSRARIRPARPSR